MVVNQYRGKALFNDKHNNIKVGDWVYGCYIQTRCDNPAIVWGDGEQMEVDPKTVSQQIDIKDVNGTPLYAGDVVVFDDVEIIESENGACTNDFLNHGAIFWNQDVCGYDICNRKDTDREDLLCGEQSEWIKLVGNVHDNAEL